MAAAEAGAEAVVIHRVLAAVRLGHASWRANAGWWVFLRHCASAGDELIVFLVFIRDDRNMGSVADDDVWLTTGEAAVVLGSSRQHVVDLCERGHLSYIKIGTHRRLRRAEVEALAKPRLNRDQERSLWLHRVVAGRVVLDPGGAVAKARANLDTLSRAHQGSAAHRWVERWRSVLDGPLDALLDILTSASERAVELRQNSPFAGVLSEQERQAALASFGAHWRREHVA